MLERLLVAFTVAGVAAVGAEPDPLFGSPWDLPAWGVVVITVVDLVALAIILLVRRRREWRSDSGREPREGQFDRSSPSPP